MIAYTFSNLSDFRLLQTLKFNWNNQWKGIGLNALFWVCLKPFINASECLLYFHNLSINVHSIYLFFDSAHFLKLLSIIYQALAFPSFLEAAIWWFWTIFVKLLVLATIIFCVRTHNSQNKFCYLCFKCTRFSLC